MTPAGLPHSDTPGSQLGCQLPRAYRRLQRPSSALDAKASTMCPSQLVSQTLNKNHKRHTPPPPNQRGSRALQNKQTTTHPPSGRRKLPDARVHYPHVKHPTHQPPPTPTGADRERRHRTIQPTPTGHTTRAGRGDGPDSSGPNSVPPHHPTPMRTTRVRSRHPTPDPPARSTPPAEATSSTRHRKTPPVGVTTSTVPLVSTPVPQERESCACGCVLLRKEVIQPHLPVRLPCYDFVPIASPTFDHSLPCHKDEGLGHGLRVLPTFVT